MKVDINKVPYEEDKTENIMNVIYTRRDDPTDWYTKLSPYSDTDFMLKYHDKWPILKKSSRQVFQIVFGRQLKCVDYSYRNWVWTFSDKKNTACMNILGSVRGISYECRKGSDLNKIEGMVTWLKKELLK